MPNKPKITQSSIIASSKLFEIEQLDLQFANGERRCFERIRGRRGGAVLILPLLNSETILLVREYAAGLDNYELGFSKGLLDPGETPLAAADRELMEEVGYGAKTLTLLKTLSAAPGYMTSQMHVVVAQDLYEKSLAGDEPEPLEVVPWSLTQLDELIAHEEFSDARCVAALLLLKQFLKK